MQKEDKNIIPIIEPKQNNSLKYVETIGQLYFHMKKNTTKLQTKCAYSF